MRHFLAAILFLPALAGLSALPCRADDAVAGDDDLVQKVRKAIDEGLSFLRSQQRKTDGSWELGGAAHPTRSPSSRLPARLATSWSSPRWEAPRAAASAAAPLRCSAVTRKTWIRRFIDSSRLFHSSVMCRYAAAPSPR